MSVEEPKYTQILKAGAFEIRDYPGLIVAEVEVRGERREAMNAGFRLLAGYIFGGNAGSKNIAMTAPVTQAGGSKIAMTAPVSQSGGDGAWTVQFTMPAEYGLADLPVPNDQHVSLRQIPPRRVAVLTFSGFSGDDKVARRTRELEAILAARKLTPAGAATLARYDPPWTPWFMRRNEVMIPLGTNEAV